MQKLTRAFTLVSLTITFGCEATVREDHPSQGLWDPFGGWSASPPASGSGGASSSGGAGGAGGGAGGGASCLPIDRLCAVAITYPLGAEASVELRGNFAPNGWAQGIPMKISGGSWIAAVTAPWGVDVQYKFVVNGSTWLYDVANGAKVDDGFGGYNSLLKATRCEAFVCAPKPALRFAIIGDYGVDALSAGFAANEASVADLVKSWSPDLILTVGDNNYPSGAQSTIDQNIGKYFHDYISPYNGKYGPGGETNRFFPVLGNHDWYTPSATPYKEFFTLPGNERYWEVGFGPARFFGVDSDGNEIDGNTADSTQAKWLEGALKAASEPIKVVFMHHPPYSSGTHGSSVGMQWPFAAWGATAVFAGHDHTYERLEVDGMTYVVDGFGGAASYTFNAPVGGSQIRFTGGFGAVLADVPEGGGSMELRAITTTSMLIDNTVVYP